MGLILYLIYNILFPVLLILVLPIVLFSSRNSFKENFITLFEKVFPTKIPLSDKPIWFHAASVGEVKAISGIIKELKNRNILNPIVITTSTLTGKKEAIKIADFVCLLPLDFYPLIKKFVNNLNPEKLIITETELWPNLLKIASKKTKVFIINARISDKSISKYKAIKPLINFILKDVNKILAQSEKDTERFKTFFEGEIINAGNIKYDLIKDNIPNEKIKEFLKKIDRGNNKIITFGSTHFGEEKIIVQTIKMIIDKKINIKFIIAPRHINRIYQTEEILKKANISYIKWSNLDKIQKIDAISVLLIDEIGFLISFYSISDICFIGGTLDNTGGHNLLEPAQFSKPVLFGPNYKNAYEGGKRLLEYRGGFIVKDEYELKARINLLLSDERYLKEAGENSLKALKSLQGASDIVIYECEFV